MLQVNAGIKAFVGLSRGADVSLPNKKSHSWKKHSWKMKPGQRNAVASLSSQGEVGKWQTPRPLLRPVPCSQGPGAGRPQGRSLPALPALLQLSTAPAPCSALTSPQLHAAPSALRAGAGAVGAHPGLSGMSPLSGVTRQPPEPLSLQRVWRVGVAATGTRLLAC